MLTAEPTVSGELKVTLPITLQITEGRIEVVEIGRNFDYFIFVEDGEIHIINRSVVSRDAS